MSNREFPKTYLEFEGKKEINGKRRTYWIQDATEDIFDQIEEVFYDFMNDEPLNRYTKSTEDRQSVEEFHFIMTYVLKMKCSLVCLTKDDDQKVKLAGFNLMYEGIQGENIDIDLKGESILRIHSILGYMENSRDFYKEFNVPRVMKAMGLYVLPANRGEGLGERILEAREYLCRHLGIKATLTTFTSIISQKLAYRVGFIDFNSVEYEELGKIDSNMHVPDIHNHTKVIKSMYKLYN